MKRFGFLLILLSSLMSCKKDYDRINSPLTLLPPTSNVVFIINELNDFTNSIENHTILSDIYIKELKSNSSLLKTLNTTKPVTLTFSNKNSSDFFIITENDSTLFQDDSSAIYQSKKLVNSSIHKTQLDSNVYYHTIYGKYYTASNNLELLKTLDPDNQNIELSKIIKSADKQAIVSMVFNNDSTNLKPLLFTEDNLLGDKSAMLDITYTDTNLFYSGVTSSTDSISDVIDCFRNTIPQKIVSTQIAPSDTKSLVAITFDDFSIFNDNLKNLNLTESDSTQTILDFTNEIARIDNALILHSLDANLALENIDDLSVFEAFRDIEIYEFSNPSLFKNRLLPFISYDNANYFFYIDEFLIFSESIDELKTIITAVSNSNCLANTDAYKNLSEKLSNESSLFIFKDSELTSQILGTTLKGYDANAVQFVYENNYAHINGAILKYKQKKYSNIVSEAFTVALDAPSIIPPQTVKNHITNAHDIVVQDLNEVLYLISSSGQILWKKQIEGEILGKIEQIDMYKNGRLQLAFVTANKLYVLDRNGNDVSPFPLKFNDAITQPLSVFDYDKKKNYRLLITQDDELLMYDGKGKAVTGFKYSGNGDQIKTQPKHFRIGNKDYIAFVTGERLKILNRQGKTRINVKEKIRFSSNQLYLHKSKFTGSNTLGELVHADTKGNVTRKNLNVSEKHYIDATSKTLVSMSENRLNIKSKTIELDFGDYTPPRIYYLNDKIYITTTDLQSKKVYLFDSQAKSIPNFPVFGTSAAELQELDKEKGLELITQSDEKTLLIYKVN